MVVLVAEMPEAFGHRLQPRSFGLMVERVVGVGAVDDPAQQHERGIARQLVLLEDRFERAFLAVMAKLDVLDVVGNGVEPLCLGHHLVRRRKDEFGVLVDELLDEPGAGDAVDLDVFSGNPLHLILLFDVKFCGSRVRQDENPAMRG